MCSSTTGSGGTDFRTMQITKDYLTAQRANLAQQAAAHKANLHACEGALQVVDQLLAELAKSEPAAPAIPRETSDQPANA